MKVRANGLSLPDLDTLAALETGRYWTPTKRPGEALYRPAVNNGYWAEDIITDGLVLYVPLWLYSGAKFPSVDAYKHTCTKTGVTWGPQGGSFDGSTSKITFPSLCLGTEYTIFIWLKLAEIKNQVFASLSSNAAAWIGARDATTLHSSVSGELELDFTFATMSLSTWYFVIFRRTGGLLHCYLNTVESSTGGLAQTAALTIDQLGYYFTGGAEFHGTEGKILAYNRALSLAERVHTYNVTRWRFA
jgi:hypothetical protein